MSNADPPPDPEYTRLALGVARTAFVVSYMTPLVALLTIMVLILTHLVATLWAERKWTERRFDDINATLTRIEARP